MASLAYAIKDPILGGPTGRTAGDADSRLDHLERQIMLLNKRINQEQPSEVLRCQAVGCRPINPLVGYLGKQSARKVTKEYPELQSARKAAFVFVNVIGCISAPKIYFLGFVAGYAWNVCKTFFEMAKEDSVIACQDACGSTLAFNLAQISLNPVLELAVATLSAIEHMAHHSHLSFLKTFSHMGFSQLLTGASLGFVACDYLTDVYKKYDFFGAKQLSSNPDDSMGLD